jgi:hypothetical protein
MRHLYKISRSDDGSLNRDELHLDKNRDLDMVREQFRKMGIATAITKEQQVEIPLCCFDQVTTGRKIWKESFAPLNSQAVREMPTSQADLDYADDIMRMS